MINISPVLSIFENVLETGEMVIMLIILWGLLAPCAVLL